MSSPGAKEMKIMSDDLTTASTAIVRCRYVLLESAIEAVYRHYLRSMDELKLETKRLMNEKRQHADEVISLIEKLNPKVGSVLTLEQFEEYVILQKRLLEILKRVPHTKSIMCREFDEAMKACRSLVFPKGLPKFATSHLFHSEAENGSSVTKTFPEMQRYTLSECAVGAVYRYFLKIKQGLDSELERQKKIVHEMVSEIATLNTRPGCTLTLDQFEAYVDSQRRLVRALKNISAASTALCEEFDSAMRASRKLAVPHGYLKLVTEPSELRRSGKSDGLSNGECSAVAIGTSREPIKIQVRYTLCEAGVNAMCCYFEVRKRRLDSKVKESMKAVTDTIAQIERLDPKVGRILTIAQFEEYVALQKRLRELVESTYISDLRIAYYFDAMLKDVRKVWFSDSFAKFIYDPLFDNFQQLPSKKGLVFFNVNTLRVALLCFIPSLMVTAYVTFFKTFFT